MPHLFSVLLMLHVSMQVLCVHVSPACHQCCGVALHEQSPGGVPALFCKSTQHKAASMLVQIQSQKCGTAPQIEP